MTLVRFNPAKEVRNIERELNRVWNGVFNRFGNEESNDEYENAVWSPLTDIAEDDNNYFVHADLPGVEKKDLKLEYIDGQLTISGERKNESEEKGKTFHRVERSFGRYFRSFRVPEKVVVEKIEANFKDGQLTITIPKAEDAKPKKLDIHVN
ncbi:MAG: Hsp20/alpha crystallin family protein [Bacteroidetes bacterium]|nr:Hsp20/alpha crystallin family protein [Bacteroidota bacterium]